ncbi:MAG TPA: PQQ-dependent dehydrogenase, methanol/ethanol family [Longimicrobium sp.]
MLTLAAVRARATRLAAVIAAGMAAAGCGDAGAEQQQAAQPPRAGVAASAGAVDSAGAAAAAAAEDGQWLMQTKDYRGWRYSALDEINTTNVHRLRIAWSFSDGTLQGHEGAPVVVGSTMFVVTPFPNIAYALDLSQPGTPLKWTYSPGPSPMAVGKACCDVVLRGWVYADGKLFYNLLDGHTVAVDAETGREVWRRRMADPAKGATMTMAPLVVRDKVLVGNSGGEMGVLGWIAALDVATGREVWRAYSAGPDSMVRIGPEFRPFYPWMRGRDLGVSSWPADMWKQGAGAVWAWITYDPDLDLIYYGTSNPGPRVGTQRPGLNLWTSAMFARDPDTGMARWAYQFTPHDEWDYDGVNENILVDIPVAGRMRKALVHFDRNGFAYTMDRVTGEVLIANQYVHQNWSTGIDLATGLPRVVPEKRPRPGITIRDICPPDLGGKDWQPAAYSPRTGLFYVPTMNMCMDLTDHEVGYIAGTPYDGMEIVRRAGPGGNWGEFIAWDARTGRKVWGIKEAMMTFSGALVTAGDVAFYGTVDGWFRAVDARSGRVLWSQKLSSGIVAQPMTYRGPDGRQYIAIYTGVGGAAKVTRTQPGYPPMGGTLYVFSLDGNSPSGGPSQLTNQATVAAPEYESPHQH